MNLKEFEAMHNLQVSLLGKKCEFCDTILTIGNLQLGHRIPQTKGNLKKYGKAIIHHPLNLAGTCSLRCNGRASIRNHPVEIDVLVAVIRGKIC